MALTDRLKAARERKGWSQRDLAKESGVPYSTIWRLENGATLDPKGRLLHKLATALEVSVDYLLGGSAAMQSDQRLEEVEDIERAYQFVKTDPKFQFGTRVKGELSIEAKRFIVELYEAATERKLLL
jgi:transcriptional regulator with XRE-family HTH domain